MQSVKNTRPCFTLLDTHGVDGRVIVRARNDKKRFHKRAWWQQVFRVKDGTSYRNFYALNLVKNKKAELTVKFIKFECQSQTAP